MLYQIAHRIGAQNNKNAASKEQQKLQDRSEESPE
jgi:hypothetical protein